MLLKMYRYHNMVQGLETGVLTVKKAKSLYTLYFLQSDHLRHVYLHSAVSK